MKFNIDKNKLGNRIFKIRSNMNLTLDEFGKIINASKSSISEWEKGKNIPNRSRLEIIAKKGNITVNELLYGSPKEFLYNNIDILFSNLDNNTGFFKNILNILDRGAIILELSETLDINNLTNVEKQFKKVIDDYFLDIKSNNENMIRYIKNNYELAVDIYNILYGGGFFNSLTTHTFNRYLNERNIDTPTDEDLKDYNSLETLDDFLNAFNDSFINYKFKDLLEEFYSNIQSKQTDFKGDYDGLYFISIDFETFKNITYFYTFKDFFEATRKSDYYVDGGHYTFPYKPNKYKISGFKDVIGLYMNDTDTTYFLANYSSSEDVPLNTEAKYFILNHDNTYQITKITEIPNCKYIAPIIGILE